MKRKKKKIQENQIISIKPPAAILENPTNCFQLRTGVVLKRIFTFPLTLRLSKKYLSEFLKFCSTFQRTGKFRNLAGEECNFNSFALYYDDLQRKNIFHLTTKLKQDVVREFIIKNRHLQPLSCLIAEQNQTTKWVIGLHGWTENKFLALRLVDHFWHQGYSILTFDAKGHGLSYGATTDIGYQNAADTKDLIDWLQKHYQVRELGVVGNSMGGATVCSFVGQYGSQYSNLKWAIADSAFADLKEQMRYVMQYRYQRSWWLISFGLSKAMTKHLGVNFKDYQLGANFKFCPRVPILFSHGTADTFVPVFMSKKLYQQKIKFEQPQVISDIYLPENIEHVRIIADCNSEYRKRISNFIRRSVADEK